MSTTTRNGECTIYTLTERHYYVVHAAFANRIDYQFKKSPREDDVL